MRKHILYLWYVIRHKWFVLVAGRKTKAPLWRLLIHDWSKFTPAEWGPYVRMFYGAKIPYPGTAIEVAVRNDRQVAFDAAWLHHQHHNPHHWQHWLLREDDGPVKALEMPQDLVREMIADWMGAGRAITGKWEVQTWFAKNEHKIVLHPRTKELTVALINRYG